MNSGGKWEGKAKGQQHQKRRFEANSLTHGLNTKTGGTRGTRLRLACNLSQLAIAQKP